MTVRTDRSLPGYIAGTWMIDPIHSEIGFAVRHLMVSKVRGRFTQFSGQIVTGESPLESIVVATVDLNSVDTGNADRDRHIRSADFLDVARHKEMTFRSTRVRQEAEEFALEGELTLRGITRPITLRVTLGGFGPDPFGSTRVGFTAMGSLKRSAFGIDFNSMLDTGGVVLGDRVDIELEIEAIQLEPA